MPSSEGRGDLAEADALVAPLAKRLHHDHMACFGIAATMQIAEAYNRARYAQHDALRRRLYRESLQELLDENGPSTRPRIELHDGWALDTSMSLPHLDRVLEQGD